MIEAGFTDSRPEHTEVGKNILQGNVSLAVGQLKLSKSWVIQQDNDPEDPSKSTTQWLHKKKSHLLGSRP